VLILKESICHKTKQSKKDMYESNNPVYNDKKSKGEVFRLSATLKDSLEYRLKRDGYVEGIDMKIKSLYSITPKGRKLLHGWIAFLSAYS